jgi:hypothetical protein
MISDSPTADPLDCEIAVKASAIMAAERQLEIDRAELRALQRAATLRPATKINGNAHTANRAIAALTESGTHNTRQSSGALARGKARGSLNQQWRVVMGGVVAQGNQFLSPEGWAAIGRMMGYDIDTKRAAGWLRRGAGIEMDFIERNGDSYRVTDAAIERFGLAVNDTQPPFTKVAAVPDGGTAAQEDRL